MLITLSSQGENDPALFQNTFSEAFVVEPNSYVCLISASILQTWENGSINIAGGTTITIRYDALNCVEEVLNIVNTRYTINDFVNHLNTLFGGLQCLGSRFTATVESNPTTPNQNGTKIFFRLTRTNADNNVNYLQYIYPVNTGNPAFRQQQNSNFVTMPTAGLLSPAITNLRILLSTPITANYNYAAIRNNPDIAGGLNNNITLFTNGPTVDYGNGPINYKINNIPNRDSFQHLRGFKMENPNWTNPLDAPWSMFCIASTPTRALHDTQYNHTFRLGASYYDNASNTYTSINFNDPGLELIFQDQGILQLVIGNRDTDEEDTISNTNYKLGNQYKVGISIDQTPNRGARGIPNVVEFDYDGLVYWIPGTNTYTGGGGEPAGTNDLTWNSRMIYAYPGINFLYENQNLDLANINLPGRFVSTATIRSADNSQMGCWASIGFQQETSYNAINYPSQYSDDGLDEAMITANFDGLNWSDFTQGLVLFQRRDANDGPGTTSTKKNHLQFGTEGLYLSTRNPTCFTCLFYVVNDAAVVDLTQRYEMCLFGSSGNGADIKSVQLNINHLASGALGDITITDSLNNSRTNQLIDPLTGNRVNIITENWYMFSYYDDGALHYRLQLTDLTNNTTFYANQLGGRVNPIAPLNSWGGMDNPAITDANNYFSGYLADFRFYSRPFRDDFDVTEWENLLTNLTTSYVGGRGAYTNEIVGKPTQNGLYLLNESKYSCFDQTGSDFTTTPMFYSPNVVAANFPDNLYSFTDIFMPLQDTLPISKRKLDVPGRALIFIGNGLVECETLNEAFELEGIDGTTDTIVRPFVWTDTNTPYFTAVGDVADIELDDEVFNVEIKNFPHRSMNGVNKSYDKTIYQIPLEQGVINNNLTIHEHSPANKVWIPLKNPGEMPLNQIEVQISKSDGKKAENLNHETHLVIQVETREDIL